MFESEFEPRPDCKPDENLKILPFEKYGYYKVLTVEPIPELIINMGGTIPAAGLAVGGFLPRIDNQATGAVLQTMNLEDGNMAKYYIDILDRFLVIVNQPSNDPKFSTKGGQAYMNINTPLHQRILWQFEDDSFALQLINPTAAIIPFAAMLRIRAWGYQYKVKKLASAPANYTVISCASMKNISGGL